MSATEPDLETRASSAYVQKELAELLETHLNCFEYYKCALLYELADVLDEWRKAEAELAARKAESEATK